MITYLRKIFSFFCAEWKLNLIHSKRRFGNFSLLSSPLIIIIFYVALHIIFYTLGFYYADGYGTLTSQYVSHGMQLIVVYFLLMGLLTVPIYELMVRRSDWELMLTSPAPKRLVAFFKITSTSLRSVLVISLLFTPLININIYEGDTHLIGFYPAFACLVFCAATAVIFFISIIRCIFDTKKAPIILSFAALFACCAVIFYSMMSDNRAYKRNFFNLVEEKISSYHFLDWLSSAFYGNVSSFIIIAALSFIFLFIASDNLISSWSKETGLMIKIERSKEKGKKFKFSNSIQHAVFKKEFRLIRRDWRFFRDVLAQAIILLTLFKTVVYDRESHALVVVGILLIIWCGLVENDISWRVIAVDENSEFVAMSPKPNLFLAYRKLISAIVFPLIIILCFGILISILSPVISLSMFVFGVCCILTTSILNLRIFPIQTDSHVSRTRQDVVTIVLHLVNIFIWSGGFCAAVTGYPVFALLIVLLAIAPLYLKWFLISVETKPPARDMRRC